MGQITIAGQEQSAGIAQVNQTIVQVDRATRQNAALVEEAAAAARSLQDQASGLAHMVSVFKVQAEQVATGPAAALRAVPVSATGQLHRMAAPHDAGRRQA